MNEKNDSKTTDIVKKKEDFIVKRDEDLLKLGPAVAIDMSGLTEEQRQQLIMKAAEGMIDVGKKAQEQSVDTATLDKKLGTMATHTAQVSEKGGSITITSTTDDTIGRTEIIMGDSEAAKKGKLSRSQTGTENLTYVWVGLAVFIVIVIAIVALIK